MLGDALWTPQSRFRAFALIVTEGLPKYEALTELPMSAPTRNQAREAATPRRGSTSHPTATFTTIPPFHHPALPHPPSPPPLASHPDWGDALFFRHVNVFA
jgi:hypothetical protein